MRTEEPRTIRLADYRPPDWLVDTVELNVALHATATRVRSRLQVRPNPAVGAPAPLVLDGDDLQLVAVKIDGATLPPEEYVASPDRIAIAQPPNRPFAIEIETEINPSANTQLMGLYRSATTYCTQCEPEGFRRISYFPDRPDVMAVYTTRIEADKAEAPVLLANGNCIEAGDIPGTNRHFAVWHDPFKKPSYLFAMVGGDLACVENRFVTMSGREVTLRIYVEHGNEARCAHAMDSLKRSMRWDEQAFGREYDLDIFMIVAVSDFNMGAMENKGLNIFNDKYVLATPETATDTDFASIEAIIAHEYFHNWTGNRITCRDWFQLCVKEGLTVFRDQEFTSDQRSRAVKRIVDVRVLRGHQFVEDAGPLAHPVRPSTYREINNFYTATVYEKGAEIVRMIKTLLGPDVFRKGMDLYFQRHDGEAATVEQFVRCFADASGRNLDQIMRWYQQAGTPRLSVSGSWDAGARTYTLGIEQSIPPTPESQQKLPMLMPLALGLLDANGHDMALVTDSGPVDRGVLTLTEARHDFVFRKVSSRPVLSLNRGFSVPVNIDFSAGADDLPLIAAHDSDSFNRWQAVQTLATKLLVANASAVRAGSPLRADESLAEALRLIVSDEKLEPAYRAQCLLLPSEADIAREIGRDVDPDAIFNARQALREALGNQLAGVLSATVAAMRNVGPYSPDAASAGRRSLKNAALDLLVASAAPSALSAVVQQYETADNMTDRFAALGILALRDTAERSAALADFYGRYRDNPLVIDKWFALQATIPEAGTLDRVQRLMQHPSFSVGNPNRVRSLVGSFAQGNPTQFNRADGRGFDFVVDTALVLDPRNPQLAARMMGAFKSWRVLEPVRRERAEAALRRAAAAKLSRDVADIVQRALADAVG